MFTKVLVPLDGSPLAEQAIAVAARIAIATQAGIHLVTVHERARTLGMDPAPETDRAQGRQHEAYLQTIAEETRLTANTSVTWSVRTGDPVEAIGQVATEQGADLIVMTSHGRTGFSRFWLGSVADGVVRYSGTPVLLLRNTRPRRRRTRLAPHFRRVLVPLDGSVTAAGVLDVAGALAEMQEGKVLLLRVVPPVPLVEVNPAGYASIPSTEDEAATRALVREAARELGNVARQLARHGVVGQPHVLVSPAVARTILEFAESHEVDAIAMATHGRGVSRLVVGSVADKVLRGSTLPILLRRQVAAPAEETLPGAADIEQQLITVAAD